jgi:WD40 repeat protein
MSAPGTRGVAAAAARMGLALALGASAARAAGEAASARAMRIPLAIAAKGGGAPACEIAGGTAAPLSGVAFSPDGKRLAAGGYGEVLVWDLAGARLERRLGAGRIGSMVQAVLFDKPGNRVIAAAGEPYAEGRVLVFDLATGEVAAEFKEPRGVATCLALSPDGKWLAAGSGDAQAYVWNLEEKTLAATLKQHALSVLCVSFSGDGKYLVTGGADKVVQVWEVGPWTPDRRETHFEESVRACYLRSSRASGATVQHQFAAVVGGKESRSIQVRLDDKAQPWARKDTRLDLPSGLPLDGVWLSRKGAHRVYVGCSDGTVKAYDENKQLSFDPVAVLAGHGDWVYGVALSADGSRLASASGDGTVKVWDLNDHALLATLAHVAPGADAWAIVSGKGYFAASSPAVVTWRWPGAAPAADKLAALADPDMVKKSLAGQAPPDPALW